MQYTSRDTQTSEAAPAIRIIAPLLATSYGLTGTAYGSQYTHLVLPQAWAFLAAGLWLGWRRPDRQSWLCRRVLWLPGRGAGESGGPRWGLVLLPMVGLLIEMLGRTSWLDIPWCDAGLTLTVALVSLMLVIRAQASRPT